MRYASPIQRERNETAMSAVTRGTYNMGLTLFKSAFIVFCIIVFESLLVFFLKISKFLPFCIKVVFGSEIPLNGFFLDSSLSARFFRYPITLYRANLSKSCFTPTLWNFIVAFVFSPLPSTFITSPMPNLSCSITWPTRNGALLAVAFDVGAAEGVMRCNLCGTMRRGGSCGVGAALRALLVRANVGPPAGACGRGVLFIYVVLSPSIRM